MQIDAEELGDAQRNGAIKATKKYVKNAGNAALNQVKEDQEDCKAHALEDIVTANVADLNLLEVPTVTDGASKSLQKAAIAAEKHNIQELNIGLKLVDASAYEEYEQKIAGCKDSANQAKIDIKEEIQASTEAEIAKLSKE